MLYVYTACIMPLQEATSYYVNSYSANRSAAPIRYDTNAKDFEKTRLPLSSEKMKGDLEEMRKSRMEAGSV